MRCATCGKSVRRGHPAGAGEADVAGRAFYGLGEDAALCLTCLGEVRAMGVAVCEARRPPYCSLCGRRLQEAWSSAGASAPALGAAELLLEPLGGAERAAALVRPPRVHS